MKSVEIIVEPPDPTSTIYCSTWSVYDNGPIGPFECAEYSTREQAMREAHARQAYYLEYGFLTRVTEYAPEDS